MAYTIEDIAGTQIGNIIIPNYKKVTRDDGSHYFLGWRSIEPYVLLPSGNMTYYAPYDVRNATTISNCDSRAVTWVTWSNNITGEQNMLIYYKNELQLVPFGTRLLSQSWRDGGGVRIVSSMGVHHNNDGGGSATRAWDGNIFTQLEPRLTDRRFMLETYGEGAFYQIFSRRSDIHNDDHIERYMAMSLQQYLEPEQFYLLYGFKG